MGDVCIMTNYLLYPSISKYITTCGPRRAFLDDNGKKVNIFLGIIHLKNFKSYNAGDLISITKTYLF